MLTYNRQREKSNGGFTKTEGFKTILEWVNCNLADIYAVIKPPTKLYRDRKYHEWLYHEQWEEREVA